MNWILLFLGVCILAFAGKKVVKYCVSCLRAEKWTDAIIDTERIQADEKYLTILYPGAAERAWRESIMKQKENEPSFVNKVQLPKYTFVLRCFDRIICPIRIKEALDQILRKIVQN